jgi:hypothetical protein
VERGDELRLLDQAGLQGQQAEKEMAVGSKGGHGASLPGAGHSRCAVAPGTGGLRPWCAGSAGLSHDGSADAAPRLPNGSAGPPCDFAPPAARRAFTRRKHAAQRASRSPSPSQAS